MPSLEEQITALTSAVNTLNTTLVAQAKAGGGTAATAATTGGAATTKPATTKPAKAKPTATDEQMKAALMALREAKGAPAAKALIDKHAGKEGSKMAVLSNMPETWDAVVAECAELMAEEPAADEDEGDL